MNSEVAPFCANLIQKGRSGIAYIIFQPYNLQNPQSMTTVTG